MSALQFEVISLQGILLLGWDMYFKAVKLTVATLIETLLMQHYGKFNCGNQWGFNVANFDKLFLCRLS